MASKIISIREKIYEKLKKLKGPRESFSDVIERLISSQKKDPLKYFGIGKNLPERFFKEFEEIIIQAKEAEKKESKIKLSEILNERK
ncbi:MAG: antitoxin VapB family protein [Promethearchaeota archaeon]